MEGLNPDISKWEDHEAHVESHIQFKIQLAVEALQVAPEELTEQDVEALKADPEIGIVFQIIDDHIEMHTTMARLNPKNQRPKYFANLRLIMKVGKTILFDGEPPVKNGMVPSNSIHMLQDRYHLRRGRG